MRYIKEALTYERQLQQLQERGLRIDDAAQAERYLRRVGYYRLMGYLFPLRIPGTDNYRAGASIEVALAHYDFDRTLRHLIGEAIAHIEVAVRTAVTYQLAHAYGSFGHLDSANFKQDGGQAGRSGQAWHPAWLATLDGEVCRAREIFIDHYKNKYSDPAFPRVPIYMASELMSIGSLSKLVRAMHSADQAEVAGAFDKPGSVLSSWLHSLSVTRNIAAHHGRMWNRKLGVAPVVPRHEHWQQANNEIPPRRIFFTLCVIADLLKHTAADPADWVARVSDHLEPFLADRRNLGGMGAPQGWRQHPLWTV
ncbi:Abi family protein [Stenotrophomonas maltophilia]